MEDLVPTAAAWAVRAHQGQRYGDLPYTSHLVAVVGNVHRFGVASDELEAAAWLHDAVEDTEVSISEVRSAFGDRVADLVFAVTTEPGKNRRERNAATYPKLAATPGAVRLKLADRIANVEQCWLVRDARLFMYRKEYASFRAALRDDADHVALAMWKHLDGLLGWRDRP